MDWLEQQVLSSSITTTSVTAAALPTPLANAVLRPIRLELQPGLHSAQPLDVAQFLALPAELRANVYKFWWWRVLAPSQRNSPLGYTELDTGNTVTSTIMTIPPRKVLTFSNEALFLQTLIRNDFYDCILDKLLPIRVEWEDRAGFKVDMQNGGFLNEIQQAVFLRQPLSTSPVARDIISRAKRLEVRVNIWRPGSIKGVGYGMCDPAFEQLPSLASLDDWLASLQFPEQIVLIMESRMRFMNGFRLGTNWQWLLMQLDSPKRKHPAIKFIAFDDRVNFPSGDGYHWTFKDPATGAWSSLAKMEEYGGGIKQRDADFEAANLSLR